MEFLKANGVDYQPSQQHATVDYQDVVNQQEIFGDELSLFANKDLQKEVSRLQCCCCFVIGPLWSS